MTDLSKSFRTTFGQDIFHQKYAHEGCQTWNDLAWTLAQDVCGPWMHREDVNEIGYLIATMKFVPAGRYLYYAGRETKFFNNCFAMIVEDTRQGWAELMGNTVNALMCGGGVGCYYGKIRPRGSLLKRTGGVASGPVPLMMMMNEAGRHVQQGGSRRSALWDGLPWWHQDIEEFITAKNWSREVQLAKAANYNYPAPLDMTNISVCFDDAFLEQPDDALFHKIVRQMCFNGEPGMAFNFGAQANEVARNACTEFISEHDSDVCNLGSVNLSAIEDLSEFEHVVRMASKFLVCGSLRSELPYQKCREVRFTHRKIGLGLMGIHEWLLARGHHYAVVPELHTWLQTYQHQSEMAACSLADTLGISRPVRFRAIAPSGTISILAGTSSGMEPLFSLAAYRRYLEGSRWRAQYYVDPTAEFIVQKYGIDPDTIETAYKLANRPEQRIKFQADLQHYVDMGISSTLNLPEWGSEGNNEHTVMGLATLIRRYMPRLRGITAYPNNGRAGQTLTEVPMAEAKAKAGVVYDAQSAVDNQCTSGVCSM
jgi:ribonucleoside-diphosphate reductase alpha chain